MSRRTVRSQEITRPTNTDAYTAQDLIAGATAATLKFTGFKQGITKIVSAKLFSSANVATKLAADLLLFSEDVPLAVADNAAFTLSDANALKLVAVVPFAAADGRGIDSTSGADGNAVSQVANLNVFADVDQNGKLYGVLIARNAYVPVSAEKFTVQLDCETE